MIIGRVKEAVNRIDRDKELENTLMLLVEALKKLNHEKMDPDTLETFKLDEALKTAKEIQSRSHELEKEFWERKEKYKKLSDKK